MPLGALPLFSRLVVSAAEFPPPPAQRGIMDLRDFGIRRRWEVLALLTLPPPDGLDDGGMAGGLLLAWTPASV